MQLTDHERNTVRRVLGEEGYRLVTQEPGLGHHTSKAAALEALTAQELADVLRAGVVGVAITLDDLRYLAGRVAQVGQMLMAKAVSPIEPARRPDHRQLLPTGSSPVAINPNSLIRLRHSKGDTLEEIAKLLNTLDTHGEHNRQWTADLVRARIGDMPEPVAKKASPRLRHSEQVAQANDLIKRLRGEGRKAKEIAHALNRENIPRRRGQAWDVSSVTAKIQSLGLGKVRAGSFSATPRAEQIIRDGWSCGIAIHLIIGELNLADELRNGVPWNTNQISHYARCRLGLVKREPGGSRREAVTA